MIKILIICIAASLTAQVFGNSVSGTITDMYGDYGDTEPPSSSATATPFVFPDYPDTTPSAAPQEPIILLDSVQNYINQVVDAYSLDATAKRKTEEIAFDLTNRVRDGIDLRQYTTAEFREIVRPATDHLTAIFGNADDKSDSVVSYYQDQLQTALADAIARSQTTLPPTTTQAQIVLLPSVQGFIDKFVEAWSLNATAKRAVEEYAYDFTNQLENGVNLIDAYTVTEFREYVRPVALLLEAVIGVYDNLGDNAVRQYQIDIQNNLYDAIQRSRTTVPPTTLNPIVLPELVQNFIDKEAVRQNLSPAAKRSVEEVAYDLYQRVSNGEDLTTIPLPDFRVIVKPATDVLPDLDVSDDATATSYQTMIGNILAQIYYEANPIDLPVDVQEYIDNAAEERGSSIQTKRKVQEVAFDLYQRVSNGEDLSQLSPTEFRALIQPAIDVLPDYQSLSDADFETLQDAIANAIAEVYYENNPINLPVAVKEYIDNAAEERGSSIQTKRKVQEVAFDLYQRVSNGEDLSQLSPTEFRSLIQPAIDVLPDYQSLSDADFETLQDAIANAIAEVYYENYPIDLPVAVKEYIDNAAEERGSSIQTKRKVQEVAFDLYQRVSNGEDLSQLSPTEFRALIQPAIDVLPDYQNLSDADFETLQGAIADSLAEVYYENNPIDLPAAVRDYLDNAAQEKGISIQVKRKVQEVAYDLYQRVSNGEDLSQLTPAEFRALVQPAIDVLPDYQNLSDADFETLQDAIGNSLAEVYYENNPIDLPAAVADYLDNAAQEKGISIQIKRKVQEVAFDLYQRVSNGEDLSQLTPAEFRAIVQPAIDVLPDYQNLSDADFESLQDAIGNSLAEIYYENNPIDLPAAVEDYLDNAAQEKGISIQIKRKVQEVAFNLYQRVSNGEDLSQLTPAEFRALVQPAIDVLPDYQNLSDADFETLQGAIAGSLTEVYYESNPIDLPPIVLEYIKNAVGERNLSLRALRKVQEVAFALYQRIVNGEDLTQLSVADFRAIVQPAIDVLPEFQDLSDEDVAQWQATIGQSLTEVYEQSKTTVPPTKGSTLPTETSTAPVEPTETSSGPVEPTETSSSPIETSSVTESSSTTGSSTVTQTSTPTQSSSTSSPQCPVYDDSSEEDLDCEDSYSECVCTARTTCRAKSNPRVCLKKKLRKCVKARLRCESQVDVSDW